MKRIKAQLKEEFDWIIGIANGGVIPALYLCYELNMKTIDTFCLSLYEDVASKKSEAIIFDKNYRHITNKKILLVDDMVDTGESLEIATKYFEKFKPSLIKTAVVYKKPRSRFIPDYYIIETKDNSWIDMPWENSKAYGQVEGVIRNGSEVL